MKKSQDLFLGHIKLTAKQKEFFNIIKDDSSRVIFLTGAAGTSKTLLSVFSFLYLWNNDKNRYKIDYLRSVVESSDRSMGFLAGTLESKFSVYATPFWNKVEEILDKNSQDQLRQRAGIGEVGPINFCRGQSWKDRLVIIDEAQDISKREMITLLTRIGEGSKVIVCGDLKQIDIHNSGFKEVVDLFDDEESKENGIHVLRFSKEDIMRDAIIGFILNRFGM